MEEYMLTTSGLCKCYGNSRILENVSISVPSKSIYGLIGENGAGKTTLFRILAGLSQQSSGTFSIQNSVSPREVLKARRRIGFMIEMPALYPNMTVLQNDGSLILGDYLVTLLLSLVAIAVIFFACIILIRRVEL